MNPFFPQTRHQVDVQLRAEALFSCRPDGGHGVFGASRPGVVEAPVGEPGGLEGLPAGVVSPGEEGNQIDDG